MSQTILLLGLIATFSICTGRVGNQEKAEAPNASHATGILVESLPESVWVIYQDHHSNYWFGGNGDGVFHYDGKKLKQYTSVNGLASNQIRGIQEDKSGNIFFDTPKGVTKYDGDSFTTLKPIYAPQNEWKSAPDDLWFKCNSDLNGAYRYDGKSLFHLSLPEYDLEAFDLQPDNTSFSRFGVYCIYKDRKDNLWFGTLSAGVYRYSKNSQFWISEKELLVLDDGRVPAVRSIIEDKKGNFWLSNILHQYRIPQRDSIAPPKTAYEKLTGIEPTPDQVKMEFPYFMSAVTDDEQKDLWMVTYSEGVWRYDGEHLFHYPIMDGDTEVLLFSIYKDNRGVLWLGTHNAGAYRFNGERFEKFEP